MKELFPGRVLLIGYKTHYNKLALILEIQTKKTVKDVFFRVLILKNQEKLETDSSKTDNAKKQDDWYRMIGFTREGIFYPEEGIDHEVIKITAPDILLITTKTIKVDYSLVLKDWDQRQIPRFRDSPPGQACTQAVQELAKLSRNIIDGVTRLEHINPTTDFRISDLDLIEDFVKLESLKKSLDSTIGFTKIANFEDQFALVYRRKSLEKTLEEIEFKLSYQSMTLYPDYMKKIQVLRDMKYINDQNTVATKGCFACEMGSKELLITELVYQNILTNLKPEEIAAVLSGLVFQAKTNVVLGQQNIPESLKKAAQTAIDIGAGISSAERQFGIEPSPDDRELNFGLAEVVYEWARQKPFVQIMEYTDVQEGIIVRCIQQLYETLLNVKDAVKKNVGDRTLQNKIEEAANAIKRDIVFADSLYTAKDTVNVAE